MNKAFEKILERLEELRKLEVDMIGGYCQSTISKAIEIVNQLAEEYGKDTNVTTNILSELKKFLKEKFDYYAEQAEMNLEAECNNSEIASYFRDRKELYLDRANIYGEVMREIDRLAEEYNGCWIPCSERLPRDYEEVLADVRGIGFDSLKDAEMVGYFKEKGKWFYSHRMQYLVDGGKTRVIAWQPLPEPFKER